MRGRVRARSGDDVRAAADSVDGDTEELEPLVVGERRALAGCPSDDETVGAAVGEVLRELAEAVVVDRPVVLEGRDDRGQDLAQHGHTLPPWR